jgi:hypothetical protein
MPAQWHARGSGIHETEPQLTLAIMQWITEPGVLPFTWVQPKLKSPQLYLER